MVKSNNDKVPELTSKEFESFANKGIVVIDFFAEWCMPCLMMAPIIEELSEEFENDVKFGKINVEDNQELAQKFGIRSIPAFILFKDGEIVDQFSGSMTKEEFEEKLKKTV